MSMVGRLGSVLGKTTWSMGLSRDQPRLLQEAEEQPQRGQVPVDGARLEALGEVGLVGDDVLAGERLDVGQGGALLLLEPALEAHQVQAMVLDAALRVLLQVQMGGELQHQAVHMRD